MLFILGIQKPWQKEMMIVATLALGLWPKQGLTSVRAEKEAQESHLMLSKVQESVREWTLTLTSEVPFWELDSWWTPKFLEKNYRSQNPLDWKVHYIIGKLLKRRCLKWAHMTHLNILNTSYGQKKGWESKPIGLRNSLYHWKALGT
jgi:hypothetical protein